MCTSLCLIFRFCHHIVISNQEHKDEDPQKVSKESQVGVINHMFTVDLMIKNLWHVLGKHAPAFER